MELGKVFTKDEIIEIVSGISAKKYSREAAHHCLDDTMVGLGFTRFPNEDSYYLNGQQVQMIVDVIQKLLMKLEKDGK